MSGCGSGPKIELCQIDGSPSRLSMDCAKGRRTYSRTAAQSDTNVCMSPTNVNAFFMACRDREPVTVDFCNVSGDEATLYCAGLTEGNERFYTLSWQQAGGYVCTNLRDVRVYLDWCYR